MRARDRTASQAQRTSSAFADRVGLNARLANDVDGFSLEQHKYGPFGPIRAKVEELAAESRTANAGEPDNGSGAFERAK
jgi:hypothetical protein